VTLPGGFAEYFTVPAKNLLPLPDGVPFNAGGLTSCAVITAVHAFRKSDLKANDTAVVLGIGGIGLLLVQLLASAGVRAIAVSRSRESLELARQAGAALAIESDVADAAAKVCELAGGGKDGADCVFEMVGLARTMEQAAQYAMRGGKIIVIGEEAEFPAVNTIQIAQRELQIIGSRNGGLQDARDALNLMARGVIRPHIAATYPLSRINEAFQAVRGGQAHGRVIVEIQG
jgi:D-arabinose 1-dehydrogenase-like Zn-dependent alcohol dehydrogenase